MSSIRLLVFCLALSAAQLLNAQEESSLKLNNSIGLRYMSTNNRGQLADFNALVAFGHFKVDYQLNPWLSFSGQLNGVLIPNSSSLETRDASTGKGPLYESNLFNLRYMDGHSEFALPILNAQINHNGHILTVGRFTKNVQAFHPEQWPFPNALEGLWYENYKAESTSWQLAVIHKAMPRFSGNFEKIGNSIGIAGSGVNSDGSPSSYSGNVESEILLVGNYNRLISSYFSVDVWNYFIEGVMNTLLVEPKIHLSESEITLSSKFMYQAKVGSGGNEDQRLAYKTDDSAFYFGLRAEKQLGNSHLQINFSRIGNNGRLLMPREWGFEPFYTFQRRTRIEGVSDASALMIKWQRSWSSEKMKFKVNSSVGSNQLPDVSDFPKNKYRVPSHIHWDASIKLQPLGVMSGLSAEVLVAYRFLTDNSDVNDAVLINNANFFHSDIQLAYTF